MGDIKEPLSLIRKKNEHKIAEFQYALSRISLRREELAYEISILDANEKATKEAIRSQEQQLKDLGL